MDVTMTDSPSQEGTQNLDKTDLIKTVRGLDQSGPGEDGKNLEKLWRHLTASADSQFHAAEQSSLRWLLKSMNGSSSDAETMRRWPLTWTILECVFQRIPLFSLAKSLADRRFIAVLHQTLKDISRPSTDSSATPSKRKRSTTKSFALEDLKDSQGCLMTGEAVFSSLKTLLGRLDSSAAQSSHDKIGAEHIRSLFCASAAEAATFASLSLTLCDSALSNSDDQTEGWEPWIETTASIWDLHLQGSDDALEVAAHLFAPSAAILSKLEKISKTQKAAVRESLRTKWSSDLQKLMHRNLILPARATFITRQNMEPISRALQAAAKNTAVAAPALYFLVFGVTDALGEGRLRKGNSDWMKQIFRAVEGTLRPRDDRDELIQIVLERAADKSASVDTDDLRSVCREYALQEESTNWRLVSDLAGCDPDVFQLSEEGARLLDTVCERSIVPGLDQAEAEAVTKIIQAILQGFRTGRDLSGFLKLWFQQLCKIEKQKSKASSPWIRVAENEYGSDSFKALIEKELSPQQLLEVLGWVESEKSHSKALCLFLDSIAQGIQSESYADAVGSKLFNLVSKVKKTSSTLTALKWGVVSKTLSWVAAESRSEIWDAVQGHLSKILSEAPIESRETYEAFKCCCQAWISMSPDDKQLGEPAELVESFTARLSADLLSSSALKGKDLSLYLQLDAAPGYLEEAAPQHYLAWFLRGSSRLGRFVYGTKAALPEALQNALSLPSSEIDQLREIWTCLLENENNVNDVKVAGDLVDRLIKALEEGGKEKRWPAEASQTWIRSLTNVHTDAFTRTQRERIMILLNTHRAKATKRVSLDGWRYILGLSTKLMSRPTFYEGMQFSDLVDVADAMSDISSSTPTQDGTLTNLINAYFEMASTTIQRMAEHIDDRSLKYFEESRSFISDCDDAGDLSPFRLTLLKALISEVSQSPNCTAHAELVSLPDSAKDVLGKCVMTATGYFLTEKKAFEGHNVIADLRLFAAVDAAEALESLSGVSKLKQSDVRKAEKRSHAAMASGDLRGWKMQTFLRTYFSSLMEETRPTAFYSISDVPPKLREPFFQSNVASVTKEMDTPAKIEYLGALVQVFVQGSDTDGQASAIQTVVRQLLGCPDLQSKGAGFDLATAHSELTSTLLTLESQSVCVRVCRVLQTLLEKKPQSMTQWNIELVLSTVCQLSSSEHAGDERVPFGWLCKLVEVVIKKHRLRLEGHHHILLSVMQALIRNLIISQGATEPLGQAMHETKAHLYARLVTLICEPTAGAVSRPQHQNALDSATDAAKRSAGRHMYLVLMQYVKLQLEADVPRSVREALEPAMNSIFDITPPEVRKILNDAMDGSGRAILREMFKRYTKFGKWSGV